MDILLTIIAIIVIFSVLVLIHEFGHFIMARRSGIRVMEFGIGFPPRVYGKKIGETLYSVNCIPFGGFVKLHGEDASDPGAMKDQKSFASKSPWIRTKVIVAGVVMNFILAIVLLTIGFSFGIEPLLVNEQDLINNIETGVVKINPGIFIAKASDNVKSLGVSAGDQITAINGQQIKDEEQLAVFEKGGAKSDADIKVLNTSTQQYKEIHIPVPANGTFGITLKPYTRFPRMEVFDVKAKSPTAVAGIKKGDIILKMNGKEIYSASDVASAAEQSPSVSYEVARGNSFVKFDVNYPSAKKVVIANVYTDSSAEKAGFLSGDIITSIDGVLMPTPQLVQETLKNKIGKGMSYQIERDGKKLSIKAKTGANNLLGVELSLLAPFQNSDLSLFRTSIMTSINQIGTVKYGPWQSFKQAISESVRLTGLTVNAFGKTISSLISRFQVPSDIGGPVQIAYYTHAFIQEGFFALLRFMALLSLSLAVINILPFPALDGGRFLFILVEVVFRKRVSPKIEAITHGIGFLILLGFIALVTYSDIVRLF